MILPVKMMFMTRSELFELVLKFWKFLRVKTQLATLHQVFDASRKHGDKPITFGTWKFFLSLSKLFFRRDEKA